MGTRAFIRKWWRGGLVLAVAAVGLFPACGDNIPALPPCDTLEVGSASPCDPNDPTGPQLCGRRPPAEGNVSGCLIDLSDVVPGGTHIECVETCDGP